MSIKRKLQLIVCGVIILLLTVVGSIIYKGKSSADELENRRKITLCNTMSKRDSYISLNNNNYSVDRNMINNEVPMGEKDTWTIFVYMCGSDYESKNGAASDDIQEMVKANTSGNIKVVVQTGGAKKWRNTNINEDKIQRFEINNGKMDLKYEKSIYDENHNIRSMGNPDELYEFLSWGIKNYSSERMGVILWNHGGGSSDGICYDENVEMDALELGELELAFCQTRKEMTSRFEFVGFDACVMQNIETANIMVPYAKYMVGSETAELRKGFNYTGFIDLLSTYPHMPTIDVCKEICESSYKDYMTSITGIVSTGSVVFSVIDLGSVDKFLYEFNNVARELNNTIGTDKFYTVLNKIQNSQRFGAGQIDIYNMLDNIKNDISSAYAAKDALVDIIDYNKKASVLSWYKNATGLSMFICSEYAQLQNYNNLRNVCISPYLMNYYEAILYGTNYGDLDKYYQNRTDWLNSDDYYDDTFGFVNNIFKNEKDYRKNYAYNEYYSNVNYTDKWFSVLKNKTGVCILDEISNIVCEKTLYFDDNHHMNMELKKESLNKVSDVKYTVFSKVYDEKEGTDVYIELGTTDQVDYDNDTGKIVDTFDGKWLTLPNGLPLAIIASQREENYIRYVSPCYINNDYVYLYCVRNTETNEIEIEGYADTYDNKFIQSKVFSQLEYGDCIQPMFMYTKNIDNGAIFKDSEMNFGFCDVNNNFNLEYTDLSKDNLYASIIVNDVFGTNIYTPIKSISN